MDNSTSFDPVWDEVYRTQPTPMKYPHDSSIRFIMGFHPRNKPRSGTRILEVGCGNGNNMWFAAREGFQVTGMDGSEQAVEYARNRFAEEKLAGKFIAAKFGPLPFEDQSFDLVVDEGGLTCTGRTTATNMILEIRRVLVDGGRFLFTPFSKDDASCTAGDPGPDDTVMNIRGGTAIGRGHLCFYSQGEIEKAFGAGWKFLHLEHNRMQDMVKSDPPVRATWRVIAEKTAL
jgi:ubiquinone/menaquinone biosynthesis C-methylase UbiE